MSVYRRGVSREKEVGDRKDACIGLRTPRRCGRPCDPQAGFCLPVLHLQLVLSPRFPGRDPPAAAIPRALSAPQEPGLWVACSQVSFPAAGRHPPLHLLKGSVLLTPAAFCFISVRPTSITRDFNSLDWPERPNPLAVSCVPLTAPHRPPFSVSCHSQTRAVSPRLLL